MKNYKDFLKEGNIYLGGVSYTKNADRMAAYNDLSAEDRKELDGYCKSQFGKQFLDCSYDEQSTARSAVYAGKYDPDEIEAQNKKDAKM